MPRLPPPLVLELEPAAAAFLDLLIELGHLDEAMLQTVNDRILDVATPTERTRVHPVALSDIKRVTAQVVQDNLDDTDPEYQRAVKGEWPLLFY